MVTVIPASVESPLGERRVLQKHGGEVAMVLIELIKPKLAVFSVLAAVVGYAVAATDFNLVQLILFILAAAMAGGGSLALNQWYERGQDILMARTRRRPLARGAVAPGAALAWALGLSIGGVALFAVALNIISALIATLIVVFYAGLYTPLKRRTVWATEVGAIAGALPPVLGAAAAGDVAAAPAWALAGIILFWQMPHFYAICAYYRKDYQAAGFQLLPAAETAATAARTCRRTVIYTVLTIAVSFIPLMLGMFEFAYAIAVACGAVLLTIRTARFVHARTHCPAAARKLFVASIVYLSVIFLGVSLSA